MRKRRAALLHGTDGGPNELRWQGWLARQFQESGYDVYFPQLPDSHTPNLKTYDQFLKNSGWDFSDSVLIGHSSGATTTLHLLQQDWFPHVRAVVLVGTFLNERLLSAASWYGQGQFDDLFVEEFDVINIKSKADAFYFVHGDNDPYCDYDEAKVLCAKLGGLFITMPGGGHIAKTANIAQLPGLVKRLKADEILN
ncbi:alpha/beta hydrolase [Candidatus Saccharibacteria bacterium]|nr:alpha/beta hydrolase [Candidatus Saccharibacteria bacterium]